MKTNTKKLIEILEDTPIIAAIKNMEDLEKCLECNSKVIFILFGDIMNITDIVARIKEADKIAFIHIDLIDGLSAREISVEYLARNTLVDGIISTKQNLIHFAKNLGLLTIQRLFLLDSLALFNIQKQINMDWVDMVEVLPGVMPKVIKKLADSSEKPIIAGGLISEKNDIIMALGAGAIAVSSTNNSIWFM